MTPGRNSDRDDHDDDDNDDLDDDNDDDDDNIDYCESTCKRELSGENMTMA